MKDCKIIRILNKRGDELLFNVDHPNQAQAQYDDYIKVANEFFEWAFTSQEEKEAKQAKAEIEKSAIDGEMERI